MADWRRRQEVPTPVYDALVDWLNGTGHSERTPNRKETWEQVRYWVYGDVAGDPNMPDAAEGSDIAEIEELLKPMEQQDAPVQDGPTDPEVLAKNPAFHVGDEVRNRHTDGQSWVTAPVRLWDPFHYELINCPHEQDTYTRTGGLAGLPRLAANDIVIGYNLLHTSKGRRARDPEWIEDKNAWRITIEQNCDGVWVPVQWILTNEIV